MRIGRDTSFLLIVDMQEKLEHFPIILVHILS